MTSTSTHYYLDLTKWKKPCKKFLPDEELPGAPEVIRMVEMKKEMSKEDKMLVSELFSNLEVAHDHMAMACSLFEQAIQDT